MKKIVMQIQTFSDAASDVDANADADAEMTMPRFPNNPKPNMQYL